MCAPPRKCTAYIHKTEQINDKIFQLVKPNTLLPGLLQAKVLDSSTGIWIQREQGRVALKTYEPALDYTLAQKTDVSNITDGVT